MKRVFLFFASAVFLLASCSHGMNKSIIEPLSVSELKANMKDTTFTDFYSEAQKISQWIIASDVRQAKFGDITYKRLKKYTKHAQDTVFFGKKEKAWKEDYDKLYPDYSKQVDSIMNHWRAYKESYNMDSLVTIEFGELWKEYYSYSGGIRSVNIGFKITPLKGKIDQLIFRYEMKTKVSNDGSISIWNGHRCVASSPISAPRTLYWEADYTDEKRLQGLSSADVKRDYDFNIELVNVRVNGENFEDKLNEIPDPVHKALKYCTDGNNWYEDDIIRLLINPDYKDFYDYTSPLVEAEMKNFDPEVHDLLKSYFDSDDDDEF